MCGTERKESVFKGFSDRYIILCRCRYATSSNVQVEPREKLHFYPVGRVFQHHANLGTYTLTFPSHHQRDGGSETQSSEGYCLQEEVNELRRLIHLHRDKKVCYTLTSEFTWITFSGDISPVVYCSCSFASMAVCVMTFYINALIWICLPSCRETQILLIPSHRHMPSHPSPSITSWPAPTVGCCPPLIANKRASMMQFRLWEP